MKKLFLRVFIIKYGEFGKLDLFFSDPTSVIDKCCTMIRKANEHLKLKLFENSSGYYSNQEAAQPMLIFIAKLDKLLEEVQSKCVFLAESLNLDG